MKDALIILAAVVQAAAALAIVYFTFRVVAANDRMAAANEAMTQEMRAEREARRQERSWEAADRLMQGLLTAQDLWQEEKTSEAWNAWRPASLYNRDVLADEHMRDCVRRFTKLLSLAAWEFLVAPAGSISDEDDMDPFTASRDQT